MGKYLRIISLCLLMALFSSCGSVTESITEETGSYSNDYVDSKDQAIISSVNYIENTITFYNYELEKSYTLSYDRLTSFKDKYGTALSDKQLTEGSIVDIEFVKFSKKLVKLTESQDVFKIDNVTDFSVNLSQKVFTYKSDSYKITEGTILISGSTITDLRDLDPVDIVTICGKDDEIYSLIVDKAHGYLELTNAYNLIDGTIELDNKTLYTITDKFNLTLAEGDYRATLNKGSIKDTRSFTITAGEITTLDLSDIEIPADEYGKVYFNVTPEEATLYVDGEIINHDMLQTLKYGTHSLKAIADGYSDLNEYFVVNEEKASIDVDLETTTTEDTSDTTESVDSENTDGYFIYFQKPSGVEVYYDGTYIGLAPVSVKKVAGDHTVTLEKSGYTTKNYSITIENTAKDDYYEFGDLALSDNSSVEDD